MRFEWDDAKDRSNQTKHGLSFTEAKQLFEGNQDYLEIFDASHSDNEDGSSRLVISVEALR